MCSEAPNFLSFRYRHKLLNFRFVYEGCFQLHSPPLEPVQCPHGLSMVYSLFSDQFDPLESAPFLPLIQKTLCLILLGSDRRISEISNISCLSVENSTQKRLFLKWVINFTPKHNSPSFQPSCPSLSRLSLSSGEAHGLCPVRA